MSGKTPVSETSSLDDGVMCYIGAKPECGCVVAISVIGAGGRATDDKAALDFIRDDLVVQRVPVTEGRSRLRRCRCVEKRSQEA